MRILLVNDDPNSCYFRLQRAFKDQGIDVLITIARKTKEAREFLTISEEFEAVFMDYDLAEGGDRDTMTSGLIQEFVAAGFGVGKKPLVAACRQEERTRNAMMRAGCSHQTDWVVFTPEAVVREIIGKK